MWSSLRWRELVLCWCNDAPTLLLSLLFLGLWEREGGREGERGLWLGTIFLRPPPPSLPLFLWSGHYPPTWVEERVRMDLIAEIGLLLPPLERVRLHITSATESVTTFCKLYEVGHFFSLRKVLTSFTDEHLPLSVSHPHSISTIPLSRFECPSSILIRLSSTLSTALFCALALMYWNLSRGQERICTDTTQSGS